MSHHDEAIENAPRLDLPKSEERQAWIDWVEQWYPYARRMELQLITRMPQQKPAPQSPEELDDLAGLIDREMAWYLARAWFVIRARDTQRRRAATRMPTPQAQAQRNDLFDSLDHAEGWK